MLFRSAILAVCLPLVAWAQDLSPPPGCDHLITIQSQSCTVRLVWSCLNHPDAHLVDIYSGGGLQARLRVMHSGAVAETRSWSVPSVNEMVDIADPMDVPLAIATGSDSYAYGLQGDDGLRVNVIGTVKASGETVVIDGRTLQVVEAFETLSVAGELPQNVRVQSTYDLGLALLITGVVTNADTGEQLIDRTPVDFILPGEAGALTDKPLYGCEGT
jgi:hypothetical protein